MKMAEYIDRVCAKCGEVKEVCCLVDGRPWCPDCFEKALGEEKHNG